MTTAPALRLTLTGVAELARVRRPVVSMWRTRFAGGTGAFPAPVAHRAGAPLFDAHEVGEWLARTDHGNNPEALADAAAAAAPAGFDWADADHVAELDALIVLAEHSGGVGSATTAEWAQAARVADPDDRFLAREVAAHIDRGAIWSAFADQLVDAAYSSAAALDVTAARHRAARTGHGSAGPLAPTAWEIAVDVTAALALRGRLTHVVLGAGVDVVGALRLAEQLGDDLNLVVEEADAARAVRRRMQVAGVWLEDAVPGTSVRLARVPLAPRDDVGRMLADAEDVLLSLDHDDVAVIVGPARALVDALPPVARRIRDDVLRSGRLRAAVRLPRGLVGTASREALALWVLGRPLGDVPLDERFTALADLVDVKLTAAARDDLVSDLLAGTGSAADVRARTFRFARLTRTASLLARSGALLAARADRARQPPRPAELAARLDAAEAAAAQDLPAALAVSPILGEGRAAAPLEDLVAAGLVRLLPGTRLAPDIVGGAGLAVVRAADLHDPSRIGADRVDPLHFAHRHPSAQLTRPGDVVFRTGPTPAAWVDHEGSSIVAHPARVLRVTTGDPGGLVPEVVATDIRAQPGGPGAWRRWTLRRVHPDAVAPLRRALADIAASRADLQRRIAHLDDYADTLTAAVAAGAVTLTDPTAAPAASELQ